MPIKVGDKLPNATFRVMTAEGPKPKTTDEIFKGKKVALFAVPGAFTPTCTNMHMPSFLNNVGAFKAKGVDTVAVTAVNDAFVMKQWAEKTGGDGKIDFLADGSADFAKAIDMTVLEFAPSVIRCWSTMASSKRSMSKRRPANATSRAATLCWGKFRTSSRPQHQNELQSGRRAQARRPVRSWRDRRDP